MPGSHGVADPDPVQNFLDPHIPESTPSNRDAELLYCFEKFKQQDYIYTCTNHDIVLSVIILINLFDKHYKCKQQPNYVNNY